MWPGGTGQIWMMASASSFVRIAIASSVHLSPAFFRSSRLRNRTSCPSSPSRLPPSPSHGPFDTFEFSLPVSKRQVAERVDDAVSLRLVVAVERPMGKPLPRHHVLDREASARHALVAKARLSVFPAAPVILDRLEHHAQAGRGPDAGRRASPASSSRSSASSGQYRLPLDWPARYVSITSPAFARSDFRSSATSSATTWL